MKRLKNRHSHNDFNLQTIKVDTRFWNYIEIQYLNKYAEFCIFLKYNLNSSIIRKSFDQSSCFTLFQTLTFFSILQKTSRNFFYSLSMRLRSSFCELVEKTNFRSRRSIRIMASTSYFVTLLKEAFFALRIPFQFL